MPRLRLIGLILFITTIFLGLAAAATKTAAIKFKRPDRAGAAAKPGSPPANSSETPIEPQVDSLADGSNLEFVSIPVIWPLCASGMLGLLLWFVPAGLPVSGRAAKRKRRRRK